ncbi:MAG: metallophosphatase family protein [Lachnospiraceae bacterium]|nr:metallophosphatase family protein [Lachnospiraceae bacterium]
MAKHKIGVISDTHNKLRKEVLEHLSGCELILHAGDICKPEILEELKKIAPVRVIRGNNDREWAQDIPDTAVYDVFGVKVFMIHNIRDRRYTPLDFQDATLVVYGHSHMYEELDADGAHFLNPGSCGPRRFGKMNSLVILWIGDGEFTTEYIEIAPEVKMSGGVGKPGVSSLAELAGSGTMGARLEIPADFGDRLPKMIRDFNRGKSVRQVARRHGISEELADQVCRMVVTHPGIGADGVMKRLGI